jgi:hypothetical protein
VDIFEVAEFFLEREFALPLEPFVFGDGSLVGLG